MADLEPSAPHLLIGPSRRMRRMWPIVVGSKNATQMTRRSAPSAAPIAARVFDPVPISDGAGCFGTALSNDGAVDLRSGRWPTPGSAWTQRLPLDPLAWQTLSLGRPDRSAEPFLNGAVVVNEAANIVRRSPALRWTARHDPKSGTLGGHAVANLPFQSGRSRCRAFVTAGDARFHALSLERCRQADLRHPRRREFNRRCRLPTAL